MMNYFKMRIKGGSWEEIALRDGSTGALCAGYDIAPATVKTDYADEATFDGVIDFTELNGLHFSNRAITVRLRSVKNGFDIEAFRRKYAGRLVDFMFEESSEYYYTGRVIGISDNHLPNYATVEMQIDADAFRYSDRFVYADIPETIIDDASNYSITPATGSNSSVSWAQTDKVLELMPLNGAKLENVYVETYIEVKNGQNYVISCEAENGYIEVSSVNGKIDISSGSFVTNASTITVKFRAKTLSKFKRAKFKNFVLVAISAYDIDDNGDKDQMPTFFSSDTDFYFFVNGKAVKIKAGETMSPYFILKRGHNAVGRYGGGDWQRIFYTEAVL